MANYTNQHRAVKFTYLMTDQPIKIEGHANKHRAVKFTYLTTDKPIKTEGHANKRRAVKFNFELKPTHLMTNNKQLQGSI